VRTLTPARHERRTLSTDGVYAGLYGERQCLRSGFRGWRQTASARRPAAAMDEFSILPHRVLQGNGGLGLFPDDDGSGQSERTRSGMTSILDPGMKLDEGAIQRFEREFAIVLPAEYREFLMNYNGGYPEPDAFRFMGSEDGSSVDRFLSLAAGELSDLRQYLKIYRGRVPGSFLPIAHDPGGNLLCIGTTGGEFGKVYFWDHEKEADGVAPDMSNMYLVADSFSDFLQRLYSIDL
jgi:cell wall assembly regulator SMI1